MVVGVASLLLGDADVLGLLSHLFAGDGLDVPVKACVVPPLRQIAVGRGGDHEDVGTLSNILDHFRDVRERRHVEGDVRERPIHGFAPGEQARDVVVEPVLLVVFEERRNSVGLCAAALVDPIDVARNGVEESFDMVMVDVLFRLGINEQGRQCVPYGLVSVAAPCSAPEVVMLGMDSEVHLDIPQAVHIHEVGVEHDELLRPHVVEGMAIGIETDQKLMVGPPCLELLLRVLLNLFVGQGTHESHVMSPVVQLPGLR